MGHGFKNTSCSSEHDPSWTIRQWIRAYGQSLPGSPQAPGTHTIAMLIQTPTLK
jgi:hypothetical protein